jgi:soluble lytic murein transglycosylase-like protein
MKSSLLRLALLELGLAGAERDLADPAENIRAGTAYLGRLYLAAQAAYRLKEPRLHDAPPWVQRRVLAAYHGGPRQLYRESARWPASTRHYVRKVLASRRSPVSAVSGVGAVPHVAAARADDLALALVHPLAADGAVELLPGVRSGRR